MRYLLILFFIFGSTCITYAQRPEQRIKAPVQNLGRADSAGVNISQSDTIPPLAVDSLQADSLKTDSVKVRPPKGDIETTINYSARDSIRATMDNRKIWLYGNAKIVYGEIELEAEEILIDYGNNTLTAHGIRDSLGQRVGYPIFKNGAELYETKDIVYNFKTRRARITEIVTQYGEGYIHADAAFKNEKNEVLSVRNSYTTCNLEHPHFLIRSTKTKAIPDDKIVSGPFYMQFNDIPLPLGFLFGMFPAQQKSSSGIIFPSYGEEKRRGFNLRGGGYFFDISEYMKLSVTGDIYSKGGHAVYANSNYLKRYRYSGTLNFAYSKNPDGDDKIETNSTTKDFRLTWSHSPQSKGPGRFAASVNAATATFNQNNYLSYGTPNDQYSSSLSNISTKLSSNVSYSRRFIGTPFTMAMNIRHNQDLQTRAVDLDLPTLSVNMTNIYPFQRKTGTTGPLDNFSLSYSMVTSNRVTNNLGRVSSSAQTDSIAPFTFSNLGTFIENGRKGMRHSLPMSFSFKALRYLTVSPSVSYEEKWYTEKLDWGWKKSGDDSTLVKTDTIKGFNRIANYSFSASFNTRIYGTYFFKKNTSKVKAIRHIVNPSVSFGYTPDFSQNRNYFNEFEVPDPQDSTRTMKVYKSRHEGFLYGGSSQNESGSIGFSLGNNLEMKVQGEEDSVARKVMLLNNLSFSSSYNLLADEYKLSPVNISANTNVMDNKININMSAVLDPYVYGYLYSEEENEKTEFRFDELAWKNGRLGRITSATLALSTNLNPKAQSKQTTSRDKIAKSDLPQQEKEFLLANPDAYVDFEIPWSLNLSYNASYSHALNAKPKIVQTIAANGDFSLSEKWKFTYGTGYDFQAKEFTMTNLGMSRDLHCWVMRFNWTPFGRFQQFNFAINVKSSILQDLKMERRKPFYDNL
ncbi:MAG TPA: putative LPS assembly protein LptD [Ohtaekwangia sp.]